MESFINLLRLNKPEEENDWVYINYQIVTESRISRECHISHNLIFHEGKTNDSKLPPLSTTDLFITTEFLYQSYHGVFLKTLKIKGYRETLSKGEKGFDNRRVSNKLNEKKEKAIFLG